MSQHLLPLLRQAGLTVPEGFADAEITGISCDSRRVGPGTLFVGLPGTQVDGGRYWPEVLAAGAAAALIGPAAAAQQPPAPGQPVLVVPDPVAAIAGELAASFWQQPSQRLALIGVTGKIGRAHV